MKYYLIDIQQINKHTGKRAKVRNVEYLHTLWGMGAQKSHKNHTPKFKSSLPPAPARQAKPSAIHPRARKRKHMLKKARKM